MLYRKIAAAVITGHNHVRLQSEKKDKESTKVAGYVALSESATVNAAAASSSQNGHREVWIKSYMRGKALKKRVIITKTC